VKGIDYPKPLIQITFQLADRRMVCHKMGGTGYSTHPIAAIPAALAAGRITCAPGAPGGAFLRAREMNRHAGATAADERAEALRPVFSELDSKSHSAAARELNRRGMTTVRGAKWDAMAVSRVRKRLGIQECVREPSQYRRRQPKEQLREMWAAAYGVEAVRQPQERVRNEQLIAAESLRPMFVELEGMSNRTAADELNRRGMMTPAGFKWSKLGVLRIRERLGISRHGHTPKRLAF
jgi:hypothetical protein